MDRHSAMSEVAAHDPTASGGGTSMCLAQLHDVALLDLDGVVYVGPDAVPHAAQALDDAAATYGMRSVFVTNNASRPPTAVADHLVQLGIRAAPSDVVTSAQAGARMLADQLAPGDRVLAIGGPGVGEALRERGLVPVASFDDGPAGVMQGYGPGVGWAELAEACLAISSGLPWVATNTDATIPTPRGRVLGNGSLVVAVSHGTGVQPQVAGKPEPPLMIESVERAGARRPIVVGDRLDTDIEGARRSGIPSMLVLTGVTDWQDLLDASPQHRPTHIGRDLRALLEPLSPGGVAAAGQVFRSWSGQVVVEVPVGRPAQPIEAAIPEPADPADPLWWIPQEVRNSGPGAGSDLDSLDLDVIRAVVAVAWAVADSGYQIGGVAQVKSTRS